jgi:hypothetical protein
MDDADKELIQKLCDAGAMAVRRYVTVSGETAATMPEYFLTCSVFDALAGERAVTLETPFWQVHEWVAEGAKFPQELDDYSKGWKIDMVIYDGGGKPPNEQRIWGFVEFKNGFLDADPLPGRRSDRDKLLILAKLFPLERPKLICCGTVNTEGRIYHKENAEKLGDTWFQSPRQEPPLATEEQFFCARLLND